MELTRLECREILAHIDEGIDEEVLAKLQAGANAKIISAVPADVNKKLVLTSKAEAPKGKNPFLEEADGQMPPYIPITLSDYELEVTAQREGITVEQVRQYLAQANAIKEQAHRREWEMKQNYKPNLNPNDAANAAFAEPDLPTEHVVALRAQYAVGDKNSGGDTCVRLLSDGQPVFQCASGHGYTPNPSVRGCPRCYLGGGTAHHDPDAIPGEENF